MMELVLPTQKVDFSRPVTGKDLDYESYRKKFELWDYVLKNNLLESPNKILRAKSWNLLNDDTIFTYSFLQDTETNQPFKYTAYQDLIANLHHDFKATNPNRFILYVACNQAGKSKLLINKSIKLALNETNKNIVMISKSLPQSQFLLASIKHTLNNSKFSGSWKEDIGETANTTQLTFNRELKDTQGKIIGLSVNRIICAPAGEGTLGYPVHYMFLDELDFYEDAKRFFWKVAYPRTNKTKGQIIAFSNPNPDVSRNMSILYELWTGDLFKRKFRFNFLDAPWNTKEEYEIAKKNSPSYIFASTHNAEFPAESGGFFSQMELDDMFDTELKNELPFVDRPVFIGLDLAKLKDRTVLSLGTLEENPENPKMSNLTIRYVKEFQLKTDYDIIVNELKRIVDYYSENFHGVARIGFDTTGVGNAIGDFIRSKGLKATDIKFSLQNKSRMYANFKLLAEQRRIKICDCPEAKQQLSTLVFKRTPAGYITVAHEKEEQHDDFPDSFCALIDVSVMPSRVPATLTLIKGGQPKNEKFNKIWEGMGL